MSDGDDHLPGSGATDGDTSPDSSAPPGASATANRTTEVAEEGSRRKPARKILVKWYGQLVLLTVGLSAAGLFATGPVEPLEPIHVLAIVGLVLVLALGYTHLRYRAWASQIRTDHLFIEHGVYRHVETMVPYVRIQHVDTSRGPIERLLGLSSVVVYTAGSRGADVRIPGLPLTVAEHLQDRLKDLAIAAEGGEGL